MQHALSFNTYPIYLDLSELRYPTLPLEDLSTLVERLPSLQRLQVWDNIVTADDQMQRRSTPQARKKAYQILLPDTAITYSSFEFSLTQQMLTMTQPTLCVAQRFDGSRATYQTTTLAILFLPSDPTHTLITHSLTDDNIDQLPKAIQEATGIYVCLDAFNQHVHHVIQAREGRNMVFATQFSLTRAQEVLFAFDWLKDEPRGLFINMKQGMTEMVEFIKSKLNPSIDEYDTSSKSPSRFVVDLGYTSRYQNQRGSHR